MVTLLGLPSFSSHIGFQHRDVRCDVTSMLGLCYLFVTSQNRRKSTLKRDSRWFLLGVKPERGSYPGKKETQPLPTPLLTKLRLTRSEVTSHLWRSYGSFLSQHVLSPISNSLESFFVAKRCFAHLRHRHTMALLFFYHNLTKCQTLCENEIIYKPNFCVSRPIHHEPETHYSSIINKINF